MVCVYPRRSDGDDMLSAHQEPWFPGDKPRTTDQRPVFANLGARKVLKNTNEFGTSVPLDVANLIAAVVPPGSYMGTTGGSR